MKTPTTITVHKRIKVGDLVELSRLSLRRNDIKEGDIIGTVIEDFYDVDSNEIVHDYNKGGHRYIGRVLVRWHNHTPNEEWIYACHLVLL